MTREVHEEIHQAGEVQLRDWSKPHPESEMERRQREALERLEAAAERAEQAAESAAVARDQAQAARDAVNEQAAPLLERLAEVDAGTLPSRELR